MGSTYDKKACLALLRDKQQLLKAEGLDRLPQRSDFEQQQVVAIKAYLGPWPRALEAAGLKTPREGDRIERNRQKRLRVKQNRAKARRCQSLATKPTSDNACDTFAQNEL